MSRRPGMYVYLPPEFVAEADNVARLRREKAVKKNRTPGNNLVADEDQNLAYDIMGARGERVSKIAFDPIVWHSFKENDWIHSLPDLGDFIDVKTTAHEPSWLTVKKGSIVQDWAYVLVCAFEHPYYRIVGWMWGRDLIRIPLTSPRPNRPAHVVSEEDERKLLHPATELQSILRQRR